MATRKITLGASRIQAGRQATLSLGNLDAQRDWGYAPEYVAAMWRMLQAEKPADYVLATGRATSVREFATAAFDQHELHRASGRRGVFGHASQGACRTHKATQFRRTISRGAHALVVGQLGTAICGPIGAPS